MKFLLPLLAFAMMSCAPVLPSYKEDRRHKHTHNTSIFKDYTSFKPVEAGDWLALNRKVAPQ